MNSAQVILYTSYLHIIGGIETFILNYIELMADSYEIGIYCPKLPPEMAERITKKAKLFKGHELIKCDTLIMVRMMDAKPKNVYYLKSIRMCHACKSNPVWRVFDDCDTVVHVSEASKKSFQSKGKVILNPLKKSTKKALILVSATRIPALDKGKNAERMLKLAKMLNEAKIPFIWFNFSDAPLQNAPKGFVNVGTYEDTQPFIAKADYLILLSDQEGFGYCVLEALINKTAVICSPFETTQELGVIDGENGYIIPFDLNFDVSKLLDVPEFEYTYDNETIKEKWVELIEAEPTRQRNIDSVNVCVVAHNYFDKELNKMVYRGDRWSVGLERAELLRSKGLVKIEEA